MFTSNKCCSRFHRSPPSCCQFQKQPGGVPALLSPGLWMVFSIQMGADMLSYNGHRLYKGIVSDSWLILPKWELAPWCSCWSPRPGRWSEPRSPGFAPARLIRNNWFSSEFFYGMAIFSITTLPITIAKNNQFVQSPILTESPNSTTAPARRRWRNIPISWEWSLCLQTIVGDNPIF